MRRKLIAGNWKMNMDVEMSKKLIESILERKHSKDVDVLICPPFTSISLTGKLLQDTGIMLGAQNMSSHEDGAYTGEVSGAFLKPLGVSHVILGHSERRKYFYETDEVINQKVKKALELEIKPILCVGETLEEREEGLHFKKIKRQLEEGLKDLDENWIGEVTIAYEPIWAIGTGKTATSDEACEMCKYIRSIIGEKFPGMEEDIRILYGGSVKPSNIKELMARADIDGALVGGASLRADEFTALINFGEEE